METEDKKLQEDLTSNKTKKVATAQTPKDQKSKMMRLESAKRVQSQQRIPNSDDIMNVTRDGGSSMGKGPYKNDSPKRQPSRGGTRMAETSVKKPKN